MNRDWDCREHFRLFIVSCHFQFIFIKGCYIIAGVCVINRGEWHCPGLWGFVFVGRWEVRQELPRSTSFWLIFLTFGGQEEVFGKKTSVPFYCSWCLPLLMEVKTRLVYRVSLRSGQQKENIHQNWLLWGQIFPWAWLGSALIAAKWLVSSIFPSIFIILFESISECLLEANFSCS